MKPKLLYFKEHGYSGYELKDVNKYMKSIGKFKQWQAWFAGSTGGFEDGKLIVYSWDFDNFMAGKPNLD